MKTIVTLNRIFTEWYRNKGKDFTITSSTVYVKKRNIYKFLYKQQKALNFYRLFLFTLIIPYN